ncbi:MAG: ABC transporter substrate-binding protein [Glaciecola sp.]|jgi:NitT/TauT family transport system ATP-binding protein/nitrate/nitrite transport system substrate-binding protein|nr:ABC transporter substrate-binding protein [Glaciecola sp.]MDG1814501.1 ABC transporter substrate-binding protein [Glaciecola sp.]MDG2099567.1 ABC transporter substrate-binding protein [Glaciecola sp.]
MSSISSLTPISLLNQIEKPHLDLGIVALTDSAPIIMAQQLGLFSKWGLNVELHMQNSWATLRDKLHTEKLDAVQMLAPMPMASSMGLLGPACPLLTAFNLSMNGNAITLSQSLFDDIKCLNGGVIPDLPLAGQWLAEIIEKRKLSPSYKPLTFAVVYPFSCHHYQLRDWLESGGIDVDKEVDIIIIPPTQMTQALADNTIDGFCVGAPWNTKAVRDGIGCTVITSCDIWSESPEKVLAVTQAWQRANPNTFLALIAALQEACEWLAFLPNRFETAIKLSQPEYLNEKLDIIAPALLDSCLTSLESSPREIPAYIRFYTRQANFPTLAQGHALLVDMQRAGQVPNSLTDLQLKQWIEQIYRPDLYQQMRQIQQQVASM